MKKFSFSVCLLLVCSFIFGQKVNYKKERLQGIKKLGVVNFGQIDDPYFVNLKNLEAPSVSGNSYKAFLAGVKAEIKEVYPPNGNADLSRRAIVEPPEVINSFSGSITEDVGIPLDNHLAMNGGQVISALNSQIAIKSDDGDDLVGFSLDQLAMELNLPDRFFDPRLLYDTEADRFIMVFLHGSDSDVTNIVIGFSNTNDATGDWSMYELTGNPNGNNTWTDYPMINVTKTDLVITGNLIFDNQPWQTGFDETVLWQINKASGYNGSNLESILYQSITFEGFNIRNLCPVESADEILESNCLFLSNRNFSVENDTIFIVELTGGIDDPNTEIIINVAKSNVPYGVPPNAEMFFGELQTNDARILEAFYLDNEIQFVGNTRNLTNNLAGIYHGRIFDVGGAQEVTLEHIIGPDFEIGYPGITHTGIETGQMDAIISFGHTAKNLNTGVSAMYYDPVLGYSDIITIKEGQNYIGIIQGPVERWGDYAGSQKDFSDPGTCWISGFYANQMRNNMPWIVKMTRPQMETSVVDVETVDLNANVFPNPVSERFTLQFEIPNDVAKIDVLLFDQQGKLVDKLMSSRIVKFGLNEFSFETKNLNSGMYQLSVVNKNETIVTKAVIVE
jgi:hypothetical protein